MSQLVTLLSKNDMKDWLIHNSPIIGLIFFFSIFCGIIIYLLRPKAKKEGEEHAKIPLKDE